MGVLDCSHAMSPPTDRSDHCNDYTVGRATCPHLSCEHGMFASWGPLNGAQVGLLTVPSGDAWYPFNSSHVHVNHNCYLTTF
jgi:hypothetical protein